MMHAAPSSYSSSDRNRRSLVDILQELVLRSPKDAEAIRTLAQLALERVKRGDV